MEAGSFASVCCLSSGSSSIVHCTGTLQARAVPLNVSRLALRQADHSRGVSTESVQSACLQLLLGYLPRDASQWEGILAAKRKAYDQFCKVGAIVSAPEDRHVLHISSCSVAERMHTLPWCRFSCLRGQAGCPPACLPAPNMSQSSVLRTPGAGSGNRQARGGLPRPSAEPVR